MSQPSCARPIPLATLVEYWLGELDEGHDTPLEEHLLGCGDCSASLQSLVDIAGGIRAAVRGGAVHGATGAFVSGSPRRASPAGVPRLPKRQRLLHVAPTTTC
jgi:hypothetical protein